MEFWLPEPLWAGRSVIVVGGGPSLRGFDFDRLRFPASLMAPEIFAVNAAGHDISYASALFFFDTSWFFGADNRRMVESWKGLAFTASDAAKAACPALRLVDVREDAPLVGSTKVRRGVSSGHQAVFISIAMGASRIGVLGFDCAAIGEVTHYHDRYRETNLSVYDEFRRQWRGLRAEAAAMGCEIFNVGPTDMPDEFLRVDLSEI